MSQNKINELKKEFTVINIIKTDIDELFNTLLIRIKKLKDIYDEIMKKNMTNNFGLDSFKFQSKIMDVEYEDLGRMYKMVTNKMYCEYYKLYRLIVQYVEKSKDTKLLYLIKSNDFPIYRDLEPYKEYDFTIIQNIHETILTILLGIFDMVLNDKEEIRLLQNKKDFGFSIDNYINSFQYSIDTILQHIKLYCDYVAFFHKTHLKYLKRIHNKLRSFSDQINNDIKFDNDDCSYKCDKQTIESVKSMIYEDYETDVLLSMVDTESVDSRDSKDFFPIYENVVIENFKEIEQNTIEVSNEQINEIDEHTIEVSNEQINEIDEHALEKVVEEIAKVEPKKRGRPKKN
jgi:hypothetical protein